MLQQKWRKGILILGLSLCAALLCAADKVEVFVSPNPVQVGVPAQLVIRSNDGAANQVRSRLPEIDGLRWGNGSSSSRSISIINGRRSSVYELGIPFTVEKEGKYTIPSLRLTHSKERTKPVEFQAVMPTPASPQVNAGLRNAFPAPRLRGMPAPSRRSRRSAPPAQNPSGQEQEKSAQGGVTLDEAMFARASIASDRKEYYVGEEIPLQINVYILHGVRAQLSWPTVNFGERDGAVLKDYKRVNDQNPNFDRPTETSAGVDGRLYKVYSFQTAFRPIAAGEMKVSTVTQGALVVPDNRPSRADSLFDDFFGGSFFSRDREIARTLQTEPATISVKALPPPPKDTFFTGLVGSWRSEVEITPPPYKTGEPVTLRIKFRGTGSLDTLRAQTLDLKGYRIYPPEIEKSVNSAEVRYILIPTERLDTGKDNLVLPPYATFNPETGKYETQSFSRKLNIEQGSYSASSVAADYIAPSVPATEAGEPERRRPEEILYLKKLDRSGVRMPLYRNALFTGVPLVILGLLFWIVCEIVHLRRKTLENDPSILRRNAAKKRKGELLARLKALNPQELSSVSGDIASYLADLADLPPGSDLREAASAVRSDSPELADMLEEIAQSAWMPSQETRFTPEFRQRLVKALSRLAAVAVALIVFSVPAYGADVTLAKEAPITNSVEAMTAYDSGKFEDAGKFYASRLEKSRPSAHVLYNMGNCLYKLDNLPRALICYERASRLAPRDSDILENLNLVRRKLGLPEKYLIASPSDIPVYLRDSLRPDEWMLLLAFGIALIFAGLGVRRITEKRVLFRIFLIAGCVLIAGSAVASLSQKMTVYNEKYAIVTVRNAPVYSLPSEKSGRIEMKLKAGEEVLIGERRMDWVRVRSGDAEGWMRAADVASLWTPRGISAN